MPNLPLHRSGPAKPFSHERMLAVCRAYRTLHEHYIALGEEMTHELFQAALEVEKEIAHWETRSARLKYEAKRQAAYQAAKGHGVTLGAGDGTSDVPSDDTRLIPSTTQQALKAYREHGGTTTPDLSNATPTYRKSGLV